MASTASPLKQAGDLGREAEEAAANGLFEEATRKYLLAAQCFVDATKHTADAQMIQSLNLLAQTHRNRAEELQLYLEAAKTLQASGGDSYYQGSSLSYSNGYDSGDDDDEYDDEPGQHHRQRGEGPTYWEGEDMIYARSSSPFGSSDPLLFVFTKDDARPAPAMVESQFYEIRGRDPAAAGGNSESESSPGSSSSSSSSTSTSTSTSSSSSSSVNNNNNDAESIMFSVDGSSDEFMSTWQRMLMGMDRLLDILPRSTIPFAAAGPASPSPTGERRSPQAARADHNAQPAGQLGSSGDAGAGRVAESFVLVPSSRSRSPSPTSPTDSAAISPAPALQGSVLDYSGLSKEDMLRELQRLNQAVEYLRAENAALVKAQEEKKEATRENEMLKESILRFRTEFEKQTHQLHQAQPVKLSKSIVGGTKRSVHPTNPLAHSALSSGGHRAHHRSVAPHHNYHPSGALHSGRSLSSSSSHFASASASPPPAASAKNPSSSLGLDSALSPSLSSSASSAQSTAMMTSAASPLSASMFWIQNIQMKRLKELEERNRALAKQLKQLRKQASGSDKKVAALEEENRRQREVIDKYDEKWKKLERSAREKMKQRRESLSRTSSLPAPPAGGGGGSTSSTIPGSLSEGSGLPILAIPALSSSPSGSMTSMHSPGSSPISSPLSSSPSSSFLMHAASSSLLSPSSSLFLNSSSIADDAGRGREH